MKKLLVFGAFAGWLSGIAAGVSAVEVDVAPLVRTIRAVEAHGKGNREAAAAWQRLSQANSAQLPSILAGMKGANQLAENWLRAAVEAVAARPSQAGGKLPVNELEAFLADTQQSPRARRLAYELIARTDPSAEKRLIPRMADDPSVELRRDGVTFLLEQAAAVDPQQKEQRLASYERAFASARDLDQIKEATAKLKELGAKPDLPRHMGFVLRWKLIGPFDNTNKGGFNVAYPPETEIDLNASYEGKAGPVRWKDHQTQDDYGMVDLNEAIGKHMGAVAYAYSVFESPQGREVEFRMGCPNGNKIWLNGQMLTANHVYHANSQVDQYVARGRLKQGTNTLLLKIAQNEQTDDWAQNWRFQLRVCDMVGTAVLPVDFAVAR